MRCNRCGNEVHCNLNYCKSCGAPISGMQNARPDDKALGFIVPINVSGLAIAAGYVGLFSIALLPAPVAIILGILALRDLKQNPDRAGKGRAIFAIIMGSIFTLLSVLLSIVFMAPSD